MSKLKKILIVSISIMLMLVFAKIVFADTDDEGKETLTPPSANGTVTLTEAQQQTTYCNVYCVAKNATQKEGEFKLVATAVVEGKSATFTNHTTGYTTNTYREVNNKIAAFVASNTGGSIKKGMKITTGSNIGENTDAQWGIWHNWNSFVDGALDFAKYAGNDTNTEGYETVQQQARNQAEEKVTNILNKYGASYCATIHYLQFVSDSTSDSSQSIIIVEQGSPKTEITVKKEWDHNGNTILPENVIVDILNGSTVVDTLTLTESNGWTARSLNTYGTSIYYTVEERNIEGYTSNITTNVDSNGNINQNATVTIKNTYTGNLIDIPVTKKWEDSNDFDGIRPTSITVKLLADGSDTGKTLTLRASNDWKGTFTNLPDTKTYTIEEVEVEGYTSTITGNQTSGYTITNTHTPEKINITVKKDWNDGNNQDGIRDTSITITLYKNNSSFETIELNSRNDWTHVFNDLDGTATYDVREDNIPDGYTVSYERTQNGTAITYTIENYHKPEEIDIPVTKVWDDDNNRDKVRPESITVKLLADNVDTGKTLTLSEGKWSGTFTGLPKYSNGKEITYTIEEVSVTGYSVVITGNQTSGYTITNSYNPEKIDIPVTKVWDDKNDFYECRPDSIKLTLYANNVKVKEHTLTGTGDTWSYVFTDLFKYENGELIEYTIEEEVIENYNTESGQPEITPSTIKGSSTVGEKTTDGFTITNKYTPNYEGYIEISGMVWLDKPIAKGNNTDGKYVENTDQTKSNDKLLGGIKVTLKNKDGSDFVIGQKTYTTYTDTNGKYTFKINYDENSDVYKLYEESTLEQLKARIANSYVEFEYDGMLYTTVAPSTTGADTSKAVENEAKRTEFDKTYANVVAGTSKEYTKVANENNNNIEEISPAYNASGENRAVTADTNAAGIMFADYMTGDPQTVTEILKYCYGNGSYILTNPAGAWNDTLTGTNGLACDSGEAHAIEEGKHDINVYKIENINLGLFARLQPDVKIDLDISKVEVIMNGQQYIYKYNIATAVSEERAQAAYEQAYQEAYNEAINDLHMTEEDAKVYAELYARQVKIQTDFQDNETFEYRGLIDPADIAYLSELNQAEAKNAMQVYVYYDMTIGNGLTTLPITVNKIRNYFDNNYTLQTNGWNTTSTTGDFHQATYETAITVGPGEISDKLELKYLIDIEAIQGLLNGENTLYNAVEIESYQTKYGENTPYAEQRTSGRAGNPYGGYDFNSHPGNAGIYVDSEGILRAEKLEDDTKIAPSFKLEMDDEEKILSGTVFEDTDVKENEERVGNGKYDSETEKKVQNVKVELYNIDGTQANLYEFEKDEVTNKLLPKRDESGNLIKNPAVQYTNENGEYAFNGFITGKEYYVKYTYGDDTSEITNGATKIIGIEPEVNARNYKSTIITNETVAKVMKNEIDDKLWYIKIDDNCSVAVDDIEQRKNITTDLYYSNFEQKLNMSAYSKSILIPVEFDVNKEAQVKDTAGSIDATYNLNKLDFGIIERPREELFTQKTISHIKLTLANGQVLLDGDPRTQDLNYIKAMGFQQNITNGAQARVVEEKVLLAELDAELTQGAKLEVQYEVTVTNNNEIDYDYSTDQSYYYYGTIPNGAEPLAATIEFVDYMTGEVVYEENDDWASVEDVNVLHTNGLISPDAYNVVKNDYRVLQPKDSISVTLPRSTTSNPLTMSITKTLTNKEENVFDNGVEIIKIDGKTARTIQEVNGEIVEKTYKPGNYVPTQESNQLEQDDDRVKVIITPPTGIVTYIIRYTIIGAISLIVIGTGIVFIKKKVLIK